MLARLAAPYRQVFQFPAYRRFWLGFSASVLGDALSRVALTWYVYEVTGSAQALGWLALCYTGPVLVGGLAAGWLLDRFGRRRVMLLDNWLRAGVVLLVPLLDILGWLALWHVYVIAALYGLLFMVPLAGAPALLPALVPRAHLATANALETLSFTLGSVVGPPLAGWLIPLLGSPNLLVLDALSYLLFGLALLHLSPATEPAPRQHSAIPPGDVAINHAPPSPVAFPRAAAAGPAIKRAGVVWGTGASNGLGAAFALVLRHPVLLSTTLMFVAFNLGFGSASVWLPLLAGESLGGGPALYGALLGSLAVGEVLAALAAGTLTRAPSLGRLIALAQLASGAALALLVGVRAPLVAAGGLALFGAFSAPLTIWAQTLRMRVIPASLRGRVFALLRTLIQAAGALGGVVAGWALPALGLPLLVAAAALLVGLPGLAGLALRALRADPADLADAGEVFAPE
jgi:MFS family permease